MILLHSSRKGRERGALFQVYSGPRLISGAEAVKGTEEVDERDGFSVQLSFLFRSDFLMWEAGCSLLRIALEPLRSAGESPDLFVL